MSGKLLDREDKDFDSDDDDDSDDSDSADDNPAADTRSQYTSRTGTGTAKQSKKSSKSVTHTFRSKASKASTVIRKQYKREKNQTLYDELQDRYTMRKDRLTRLDLDKLLNVNQPVIPGIELSKINRPALHLSKTYASIHELGDIWGGGLAEEEKEGLRRHSGAVGSQQQIQESMALAAGRCTHYKLTHSLHTHYIHTHSHSS